MGHGDVRQGGCWAERVQPAEFPRGPSFLLPHVLPALGHCLDMAVESVGLDVSHHAALGAWDKPQA